MKFKVQLDVCFFDLIVNYQLSIFIHPRHLIYTFNLLDVVNQLFQNGIVGQWAVGVGSRRGAGFDIITSAATFDDQAIEHVFKHAITGPDIIAFQRLVRRVPVAESVARYAVHLVRASRPTSPTAPDFIKQWVTYGASTRAAQYLVLGGKARALMQGRYHVSFDDVKALAAPVLRHRILTNFHAQSERVTTDQIIAKLVDAVPLPKARL